MAFYSETMAVLLESNRKRIEELEAHKDLCSLTDVLKEYWDKRGGESIISWGGSLSFDILLQPNESIKKDVQVLLDEFIYPRKDLEVADGKDLEEAIKWEVSYLNKTCQGVHPTLDIFVYPQGSKHCHQEGTGEFREVMEWVCD